ILFPAAKLGKTLTLKEYTEAMPEGQKDIYYACGETVDKILMLPQVEAVLAKGYEVLCFTEDVDEFAVKMLRTYGEKEFKNITDAELGFEAEKPTDEHSELMGKIKAALGDKVADVKASARLVSHPACLSTRGEISIEMEKVLSVTPDGQNAKAEKVLEINTGHALFAQLEKADEDRLALLSEILLNQAMLIEGLPIEDPVSYSNAIWKLLEQ
ncbi:MAG: molecular chaperone HtpG, partial [Clostridia bacterium]|nr:molecular chaperone HtpG [Clostridia bacterium]